MSMETRRVFLGSGVGMLNRVLRKWLVSFMYDGMCGTSSLR